MTDNMALVLSPAMVQQVLPPLRTRIRQYVHDIILHCVPWRESAAYQHAVWSNPQLVMEQDSDPLLFIRYYHYDKNIWSAAQRLCLYWTERLALFGRDRAVLPLTLTGTGALRGDDLMTLEAGFPALLPPTATGQGCLLIDRRKRVPHVGHDSVMRAFFYCYHVLAETECAAVPGIHRLAVSVTPPRDCGHRRNPQHQTVDLDLMHKVNSLVSNIFPVRVQAIHLLCLGVPSSTTHAQYIMTNKLIQSSVNVMKQFQETPMIHVHVQSAHEDTKADDTTSMACRLQKTIPGLSKEGIPTYVGGTWTFNHFYQWCQVRKQWETTARPSRCQNSETRDVRVADRGRLHNDNSHLLANADTTIPQSTAEKPSVLNNTANRTCENQHSIMALDSHRPVQHAQQQHGAHQDAEQDRKRAKKRLSDMLSSRRKRERRREEFKSIQQESERLVRQHKVLQMEHDRLLQLLQEANEMVDG